MKLCLNKVKWTEKQRHDDQGIKGKTNESEEMMRQFVSEITRDGNYQLR